MVKKQYRIAAIGFAHGHVWGNIRDFASCGDRVAMVAASDVYPLVSTENDPDFRAKEVARAQKDFGFKPYGSYIKLLEENDIDIALVGAENVFHPEISETLLRKGIHVVLEKPMAADMPGALRMARAARETGARIITNWPTAWSGSIRKAKAMADEGAIGKLFKFTFRNGDSQGPLSYGEKVPDTIKGRTWWHQAEMGGGAYLDYCCYGACMACWFTGKPPQSAFGLKANFDSPYGSADDYGMVTVRFPGSVAILEGSWTTVNTGVSPGPVLFGTEGTMVVQQNGKILIYKTRQKADPDLIVDAEPLPVDRANVGLETIHHLDTGEPLFAMLDLPINMAAMSILDTGIRSAASGKMEMINDVTWFANQ
jgi:predicted dehydrogenase